MVVGECCLRRCWGEAEIEMKDGDKKKTRVRSAGSQDQSSHPLTSTVSLLLLQFSIVPSCLGRWRVICLTTPSVSSDAGSIFLNLQKRNIWARSV